MAGRSDGSGLWALQFVPMTSIQLVLKRRHSPCICTVNPPRMKIIGIRRPNICECVFASFLLSVAQSILDWRDYGVMLIPLE